MIEPTKDRALIRAHKQEEKVKGGIIIAETQKEPPERGEVIAVGPGCEQVKAGDTVIFKRYSADEMEDGGEKLLMVEEADILGVVRV